MRKILNKLFDWAHGLPTWANIVVTGSGHGAVCCGWTYLAGWVGLGPEAAIAITGFYTFRELESMLSAWRRTGNPFARERPIGKVLDVLLAFVGAGIGLSL